MTVQLLWLGKYFHGAVHSKEILQIWLTDHNRGGNVQTRSGPSATTVSHWALAACSVRRLIDITVGWTPGNNKKLADKPARRVYRSVKVTKHSTIPYVRYSFLLCNIKTRRFYDIPFQRCRDLEIGVRRHSRSLKVAQFDRLCMISY